MLNSDKKYLHQLNFEEARGKVLDWFIKIEKQIDAIICFYIEPSEGKVSFIKDTLLSGSVINFGQKMKILRIICKDHKIELSRSKFWEPLHKLNNLRNVFAHCIKNKDVHMTIGGKDHGKTEVNYKFRIIQNDGEIKETTPKKALEEFRNLKYLIGDNIKDIEDVLYVE